MGSWSGWRLLFESVNAISVLSCDVLIAYLHICFRTEKCFYANELADPFRVVDDYAFDCSNLCIRQRHLIVARDAVVGHDQIMVPVVDALSLLILLSQVRELLFIQIADLPIPVITG